MAVLTDFQTNAARNDLYRARLDYLRVQNTIAADLARTRAEKEQAVAREEQAVAREEQAVAETERLKARLRALGVDPDRE